MGEREGAGSVSGRRDQSVPRAEGEGLDLTAQQSCRLGDQRYPMPREDSPGDSLSQAMAISATSASKGLGLRAESNAPLGRRTALLHPR